MCGASSGFFSDTWQPIQPTALNSFSPLTGSPTYFDMLLPIFFFLPLKRYSVMPAISTLLYSVTSSLSWLGCSKIDGILVLYLKCLGFLTHFETQSSVNFSFIRFKLGPDFASVGQSSLWWQPLQPAWSTRVSPRLIFSPPAKSLVLLWHLKQLASVYFVGSMGVSQWWFTFQSCSSFHLCFSSGELGVWDDDTKDVPLDRPPWQLVQPKLFIGWGELEVTYKSRSGCEV